MTEIEVIRVDLPREGLPDLIDSQRGINRAAEKLAAGNGPVALDAERASGFRYSQRAYLVQLRRAGSGTFLIDPTEFENLNIIQEATADTDWILHAASQDLVCLAEVGLKPNNALFDTELAGRILGLPKVGLGTLAEQLLNISLAKEHSAADWSTRPLPDEWLAYAALDVEFLFELWEILSKQLQEANKYEWALQEFEHVRLTTEPIVRQDPWRKLSGIHKLKDQQQLAIARELWFARNEIAKNTDIAAGRILNDSQLIEIATCSNWQAALGLPFMKLRGINRNLDVWANAFETGINIPASDLPPLKVKSDTVPHPRNWQARHPEAFARLEAIRAAIGTLAEELQIPTENLITPEVVRKAVWLKPSDLSELEKILDDNRVRQWQREHVRGLIAQTLNLN